MRYSQYNKLFLFSGLTLLLTVIIANLCWSMDIKGWQKVEWGYDAIKVRDIYKGQIVEPQKEDTSNFNSQGKYQIFGIIRNYKIAKKNFVIQFVADEKGKLCMVALITKNNSFLSKSDFEYIEILLQKKYGKPSRKNEVSILNTDRYFRSWNFQSTNIDLNLCLDKENDQHTEIQIIYSRNDEDIDIDKL